MKIDFARRRRVMERSQLLGHCICDVRRPCPCDVFRNDGICPCAGERPDPVDLSQVKLMELVRNAGCASKIAPAELDAVLGRLPAVNDPAVISGLAAGDDAAIYRISDDLCLVQTVDVFTPCVDDPHLFGRICAVNCLSDIYAMGGEPRTALSILAFPTEKLPGEVMYQMLAGAMEIFEEAGVALVGGHSVKDDEIKLGFAITGLINPKDCRRAGNTGGRRRAGVDQAAGHRRAGVLPANRARASAGPGRRRNFDGHAEQGGGGSDEGSRRLGLHGRDGLRPVRASAIGMLRQSKLGAEIFADALPAFDGAVEALRQGVIPGAVERNREYVGEAIRVAPNVDEALVNLGFRRADLRRPADRHSPERLEALRQSLARRGAGGFVIGRIIGSSDEQILVSRGAPEPNVRSSAFTRPPEGGTPNPKSKSMKSSTSDSTAHHEGCCADVFKGEGAASSVGEAQKAFGALIRSVQAGGVLSEKAKELILFSLVVQSRCHPCFDAHYRKARETGHHAGGTGRGGVVRHRHGRRAGEDVLSGEPGAGKARCRQALIGHIFQTAVAAIGKLPGKLQGRPYNAMQFLH